jgi:hypothetical protein
MIADYNAIRPDLVALAGRKRLVTLRLQPHPYGDFRF